MFGSIHGGNIVVAFKVEQEAERHDVDERRTQARAKFVALPPEVRALWHDTIDDGTGASLTGSKTFRPSTVLFETCKLWT